MAPGWRADRRAVRPGGDADARDVPVPPARGARRARDGRAQRASPLLHRRARPGGPQRRDDRRRARARPPDRRRRSWRWRSACWWAALGQLLVQLPELRAARGAAPAVARLAPSRGGPIAAPALARGVRAGGGAGDGGGEHPARLAAAGRHRLVPLLRRPRDGVPARRLRHRARHRGAAQHVGARPRAASSRRCAATLELRAAALRLRRGARRGGARAPGRARSCGCSSSAASSAPPTRRSPRRRWPATRSACPRSRPRGSRRRPSTRSATRARRCSCGFVSVAANVVLALVLMWPLAPHRARARLVAVVLRQPARALLAAAPPARRAARRRASGGRSRRTLGGLARCSRSGARG